MHTFPSIDEVAICMELDGVAGTSNCLGFLTDGKVESCNVGVRAERLRGSTDALFKTSDFTAGKGGGKGDIETPVIDAEWGR